MRQSPLTTGKEIQNESDAISYAESMIKRSGGDAKAAFYAAAKEKGIDPDRFLSQLSSMGDLNAMAQSMLASNPRISQLMNLFSMNK